MDFEEDTYSSIFLVLKHPVRRKILRMLSEAPATYTQILDRLRVETGFLNYHLEGLSGLVTKDKDDKYVLSSFGEAALSLITRVETPVKRETRGLKVFGFKINPSYILLVIIAVLVISNAYWIIASQELSKDKTNALGEVLIQTSGFLGETIHILNVTATQSRIDFELWDVMYKDLIELSRHCKSVTSLDTDHRQQWSQIRTSTDSLVDFVRDLTQTYAKNNTYMNITHERSIHLNKIRDQLLSIQLRAFPARIVIGPNPEVNIIDSQITEAMEISIQLQEDLNSARRAFNLPSLHTFPQILSRTDDSYY